MLRSPCSFRTIFAVVWYKSSVPGRARACESGSGLIRPKHHVQKQTAQRVFRVLHLLKTFQTGPSASPHSVHAGRQSREVQIRATHTSTAARASLVLRM